MILYNLNFTNMKLVAKLNGSVDWDKELFALKPLQNFMSMIFIFWK